MVETPDLTDADLVKLQAETTRQLAEWVRAEQVALMERARELKCQACAYWERPTEEDLGHDFGQCHLTIGGEEVSGTMWWCSHWLERIQPDLPNIGS